MDVFLGSVVLEEELVRHYHGVLDQGEAYQVPQPRTPDLAHGSQGVVANTEVRCVLEDVELDRVPGGRLTVDLNVVSKKARRKNRKLSIPSESG